jgi:hypothetical protein
LRRGELRRDAMRCGATSCAAVRRLMLLIGHMAVEAFCVWVVELRRDELRSAAPRGGAKR